MSNLTNMFGSIYSPQPYLNSTAEAQNAVNSSYTAPSVYSNQALSATQGLADLEPGSFKNMLLAAILGTGANAGSGALSQAVPTITDIIKKIFGSGSGGNGATTTTPTVPTVPTTSTTPPWNPGDSQYPGFTTSNLLTSPSTATDFMNSIYGTSSPPGSVSSDPANGRGVYYPAGTF